MEVLLQQTFQICFLEMPFAAYQELNPFPLNSFESILYANDLPKRFWRRDNQFNNLDLSSRWSFPCCSFDSSRGDMEIEVVTLFSCIHLMYPSFTIRNIFGLTWRDNRSMHLNMLLNFQTSKDPPRRTFCHACRELLRSEVAFPHCWT